MRVSNSDEAFLASLGREAARLICAGEIETLVARFGYARAFDRALVDAVRADLALCLAEMGAAKLVSAAAADPVVKYLQPNSTGLLAVVESYVEADNGRLVLLELVAAGTADEIHVSLEDVSAAA
jgi:hypothetical protein